jgi:hypothetical protein
VSKQKRRFWNTKRTLFFDMTLFEGRLGVKLRFSRLVFSTLAQLFSYWHFPMPIFPTDVFPTDGFPTDRIFSFTDISTLRSLVYLLTFPNDWILFVLVFSYRPNLFLTN